MTCRRQLVGAALLISGATIGMVAKPWLAAMSEIAGLRDLRNGRAFQSLTRLQQASPWAFALQEGTLVRNLAYALDHDVVNPVQASQLLQRVFTEYPATIQVSPSPSYEQVRFRGLLLCGRLADAMPGGRRTLMLDRRPGSAPACLEWGAATSLWGPTKADFRLDSDSDLVIVDGAESDYQGFNEWTTVNGKDDREAAIRLERGLQRRITPEPGKEYIYARKAGIALLRIRFSVERISADEVKVDWSVIGKPILDPAERTYVVTGDGRYGD